MKWAVFCDENGMDCSGSDSVIPLDGRFGAARIAETVREKRESYKKYFPHKYEAFTHYKLVPDLRREYSARVLKVPS